MSEGDRADLQALWQSIAEIRRRIALLEQAAGRPAAGEQGASAGQPAQPLIAGQPAQPPVTTEAGAQPVAAARIADQPTAAAGTEAAPASLVSLPPAPAPLTPAPGAPLAPRVPVSATPPPESFYHEPAANVAPSLAPPPLPPAAPPARRIEALHRIEAGQPSQQAPPLPPAPPAPPARTAANRSGAEIRMDKAAVAPAGPSLEQRLGTRWMLIAGVGVILLGAVFFFQYAAAHGWINVTRRLLSGAFWGVAMIVIGQVTLRRGQRLFAAGITAGGVAMLYMVLYIASPNSPLGEEYHKLSTPLTFGLMCALTLLGVVLSLQMNLLLAAVLSLTGALATPILLSTGVNHQVALMTYLLIVDAGFLALAAIKRWPSLSAMALAGTAIVFGGWFARFGLVSPDWLTDTFAWAFFAMFAAYAVIASLRCAPDILARQLVWLASAGLAALWTAQMASLHGWPMLGQMLALEAVLLALAFAQRWPELAVWSLVATAAMFVPATANFSHAVRQLAAWLCAVPVAAYIVASMSQLKLLAAALSSPKGRHADANVAIALVAITAPLLALCFLSARTDAAFALQLLALDVLVLAACLAWRWQFIRLGLVAWTALVLVLRVADSSPYLKADTALAWCGWAWVLYLPLLGDVLVRAWRRELASYEPLDAALAAATGAMLFGATYGLAHEHFHAQIGGYTAALGAAMIALAWLLRYSAQRRVLAYAFLSSGLVLVTLAMPIQFKLASITLAWAIEAVVLMAVARRLHKVFPAALSLAVLAIAVAHFFWVAVPEDVRLQQAVISPLGVGISLGLLLAMALAAACLAVSALLRRAGPLFNGELNLFFELACWVAGIAIFLFRTCAELPTLASTWWWLALGAGVGCAGRLLACTRVCKQTTLAHPTSLPSRVYAASAIAVVLLAAGKWLTTDTLISHFTVGADTAQAVILNWQFTLGVAIAVAALACIRLAGAAFPAASDAAALRTVLILLAPFAILWGGSFEINRYFAIHSDMANRAQAAQMAYSLWWSLCAMSVLVAGFVLHVAALRYLAMAVFAVTLAKVFLVDMASVQAAYRILSFVGLGALLLAGSWVYNRYFQQPKPPPGQTT